MRVRMMLGRVIVVIAAAWASAAPAYAAGTIGAADPVRARLVPEARSVAPGGTLWVDFHLAISPGWHIYWRNPGDSGLPTEIAWTLPPGFSTGEIAWPVPEHFVAGTIGTYGYTRSADLLVPIAAPATLAPGGTAHLAADASWAVCSDICVPGGAKLALDLPIEAAPATPDPAIAALFAAARDRLPKPAGFATSFAVSGRDLHLSIPAAALDGMSKPTASFFPLDANALDASVAPKEERRADGLELVLARADGPTATLPAKPNGVLSGVLVLHGADGTERAFSIAAARTAAPSP